MNKLFEAMSKAFPEIEGATKDKNNPHFKSRYADLGSVSDAIKPALVKHGLFYAQKTHDRPDGICVETIVGHSSGEVFSFGELYVPAAKRDPQGFGSALTYARRYSLMTAFGVCPEDDDGNAATKAVQGAGSGQGRSLDAQVGLAPSDKLNGAVNQSHASPRAGSTEWPEGPAKNKTDVRTQWAALKAKILDAVEAGDPDTLDGHLADEKALLKQIEIVEPRWWTGEGLPESIPGFIMECQGEAHKNEQARLSGGLVTPNGQTIINA